MKFLTEQEKLNTLLTKSPEANRKYKDVMRSHQSMMLGLISTLEEQKKRTEQAQVEELARKLSELEGKATYGGLKQGFYSDKGNLGP